MTRATYLVIAACGLATWTAAASGGLTARADRVVRFADLPHGWVKGIPRDVRPNSRIVGVLGGHRVAAAPTRNGNYCQAFGYGSGGVGGCVVRGARWSGRPGELKPYLILATSLVGPKSVIAVGGSAFATPGQRLVLAYADGTRERVSLTFVSRPIGAAFFFREIPGAHRAVQSRLQFLELRHGRRLIARQRAAAPVRVK